MPFHCRIFYTSHNSATHTSQFTTSAVVRVKRSKKEKKNSEPIAVLSRAGQRVKHLWRQLVADHAGKDHQVLGHLQQFVGHLGAGGVFKGAGEEQLALAHARGDGPEEQVADVARDHGRQGVEGGGGVADESQGAVGGEREEGERVDELVDISTYMLHLKKVCILSYT